ncbi:energy transducer TonB [Pedobacter frigiditerrae]|uniref:Energy transducer TonB n=1 Tax=Pedobacter frigiditerrae TaxID=2530452 RepID=A0A4R0MX56_9SPHI|nr:energy transducer TonB [Pedobacter frigiditerrae]TCC91859.1 energy transducer TonB [Pedobacter frigiditerrae]
MFNNSSNLYGSEWLALVFQNRNKNYGAYALRSESSSIMTKALLIVVPVFVLLFVGPMIYAQMQPVEPKVTQVVMNTEDIEPIHEMKKEEAKKEEPKQEEPAPQEPVKTKAFVAPVVVADPIDDTPPPTSVELQTAVIGSTNLEGKDGKGNADPAPTTGGGFGTGTEGESDTKIYETSGIEKFPEFPGGMAAWAKFIQKNLRYPYMAQENEVQGKVYISFVIEKDGTLSDVKLVRGIGYGCDDEAMRVIKKSPKWEPGKQNNTNVRVRYNMPINYTISN